MVQALGRRAVSRGQSSALCSNRSHAHGLYLVFARRKIDTLILDGLGLHGENFKLLKWLQQNKEYMPEFVWVVLRETPFNIVAEEIQNTPNCKILKWQSIVQMKSLDSAIKSELSTKVE